MAAARRHSQGVTMHASVRVYGLQGARQDVGAGRAGTARDEDNEHRWAGDSQPVRPVQLVRSTIALQVAKRHNATVEGERGTWWATQS